MGVEACANGRNSTSPLPSLVLPWWLIINNLKEISWISEVGVGKGSTEPATGLYFKMSAVINQQSIGHICPTSRVRFCNGTCCNYLRCSTHVFLMGTVHCAALWQSGMVAPVIYKSIHMLELAASLPHQFRLQQQSRCAHVPPVSTRPRSSHTILTVCQLR